MHSLATLARRIDAINDTIGRATAWVAVLMVIVQMVIVVMRYVFGIGSIFVQESIVYMHAVLFLVPAGYTLLCNGHVRIDIFHADAAPRTKALIDLVGVFAFLVPFCALILVFALLLLMQAISMAVRALFVLAGIEGAGAAEGRRIP